MATRIIMHEIATKRDQRKEIDKSYIELHQETMEATPVWTTATIE